MVISRTPALACILVSVGTLLSIFRLPRSLTICRYALRLLSGSCCYFWIILRVYTFWLLILMLWVYLYLFIVPRACIIILLTQICRLPVLWVMVISSLYSAFHFQYSTLFLDTDVPACGNACHIIVNCAWFTFQYLFYATFLWMMELEMLWLY